MSARELQSLIACHECDLLQDRLRLKPGQIASCARCGSRLYAAYRDDVASSLALVVAGLVLFAIMVSFPFLGISVAGVERNVSLLGSIQDLYREASPVLAILVGLLLILFPLVKVLGLIIVLLPLHNNQRLEGSWIWCRVVERIVPWNMTEIYLVGVLVTFVKLATMAKIIFGVAFWAFIGFVVVMTAATASIHFTALWDKLENA